MGRAITRLREQYLSFFLVSVLAMIPPQARGVACARWAAGSQSWLCVEAGAEGVTRLQFWEEGWEATYLGWDPMRVGRVGFQSETFAVFHISIPVQYVVHALLLALILRRRI